MDELIPSSPNWYCSSVVVNIKQSRFVYLAKNSFFVFDADKEDGFINIRRQTSAEFEKCTAIAKLSETEVLIGHENGFIRIWRIPENEKEEIEKIVEWQAGIIQITAIDAHEGKVVSGDNKANLLLKQLDGETIKLRENDQHCAIHALKFAPCGGKFASGLDLGIIYVYSTTGKKLVRLRGHEGAIQDFLWHENGLISSSKERHIRVWDLENSENFGALRQTLNLPRPSGYKNKNEDRKNLKLWTSLAPSPAAGEFICSGISGDIMVWRTEKKENDERGKLFETVPKIFCDKQTDLCHQRTVFGLAVSDKTLVSISMDRKVKIWDLNIRKPIFNLMTNGGWIYALEKCPLELDLLAIGVGDGMLRRVDTSSSPRSIQVTWQGIVEKITALSWHKKSMKIAFGTEHGKVGIWDSEKDKATSFNSFHEKRVYSIDFIGDKVASIDGKELKLHSGEMSETIALPNRATALNVFGEMIAFGFDEGIVSIFDFNFEQKSSKELHQKYVTCAKFSSDGSMLASACNAGSIVITKTPKLENFRKLAGHPERVSAVDFSPDSQKLVSAACDFTCQIWNISNCMPVANFRKHDQILMSVAWMKNKIYSGGEDGIIHTWTEADCQFKTPPEDFKRATKERRRKKQLSAKNNQRPFSKHNSQTANYKVCPSSPTKSTASSESSEQKKEGTAKQRRFQNGEINKFKKFTSVFNVDNDRSNTFQELGIEDILAIKENKEPVAKHLSFYNGKKETMIDLVKNEINEQLELNCGGDGLSEISFWLGTFQHVIENDKITDTTVALAASMGNSAWRFITEKYVEQLQRKNIFDRAATFLLALGRVEDAVRSYNSANQHKEALVLARLRLDPEHRLIEETLRLLSERMFATGNRIGGCKALIPLGEIEEAAKQLVKSPRFEAWIGAVELLLSEEKQDKNIYKIIGNLLHTMLTLDWTDKIEAFVAKKPSPVCRQLMLFIVLHKSIKDISYKSPVDLDFLRQNQLKSIFSDEAVTVSEDSDTEMIEHHIRFVKSLCNFALDGLPRLLPEHSLFELFMQIGERLSI